MLLQILQGFYSRTRVFVAMLAYQDLQSIFGPICELLGINPMEFLISILGEQEIRDIGICIFSFFCSYAHICLTFFLVLALSMNTFVSNDLMVSMLEKDQSNMPSQQVIKYEIKLVNIFHDSTILYDTRSSLSTSKQSWQLQKCAMYSATT